MSDIEEDFALNSGGPEEEQEGEEVETRHATEGTRKSNQHEYHEDDDEEEEEDEEEDEDEEEEDEGAERGKKRAKVSHLVMRTHHVLTCPQHRHKRPAMNRFLDIEAEVDEDEEEDEEDEEYGRGRSPHKIRDDLSGH